MAGFHETELPVPMLPKQFVEEFIAQVGASEEGDRVGIATMQLAGQVVEEESVAFRVLDALVEAKHRGVHAQVIVDERYVGAMTRIGNRDYPNWIPLIGSSSRDERDKTRQRTDMWLSGLQEAGILIGTEPRRPERGYVPLLRQAGSFHIAQRPFAAVHTKAAYIARTDGEVTSWVNSANLTDSDILPPNMDRSIGMNNLSVRLGGKAATFVMKAVTTGFNLESGVHVYGDRVKVIHDIGNSGEPARLPRILVEALEAIDPRKESVIADPNDSAPRIPRAIALLSQYAPNGLLLNALDYAATTVGAYTYVPLQPKDDHRSSSFPYNLNNRLFNRRVESAHGEGIITVERKVPSHLKALIVAYDDATVKLVIGTDNFVTNLQKVVRNEELAVAISLDCKKSEDATYFRDFVELLYGIGELDETTRQQLLMDTLA